MTSDFKKMIGNFLCEKEKNAFNEVCNLSEVLNPHLVDLIKILVISKNEMNEKFKLIEFTTEHNEIILENNIKNLKELNDLMNEQFKDVFEELKNQELYLKNVNEKHLEKIAELTKATADDYLNLKCSNKALESKCDRSVDVLKKYINVKIPQVESKINLLEKNITLLERKVKNNIFKKIFIIYGFSSFIYFSFNYFFLKQI